MSLRTMQPSAAVVAADMDHLHRKKNGAHPSNTNNEGANAREIALLRRVVNAATTQIGGPASGGLAPLNPGLTRAAAGLKSTGHSSFGAVTLISTLTKNTGG